MSKMTRDEIAATEFYRKHAASAVEWYLSERRQEIEYSSYRNLDACCSPLEGAFLTWWMTYESRIGNNDLEVHAQVRVDVEGQVYRPDFVFTPTRSGFFAGLRDFPKVAVELDGHDFHEKTKEQVAYRNKRDRDLQAAGWIVLHVSGSEFNRDPLKLIQELREAVTAPFYKAYHAQRAPRPIDVQPPQDHGTDSND